MFLREALCRDAEIQEDIANLYANLASRYASDAALTSRLKEMEWRERRRSRVLLAIVAAQAVSESDGPFLVHVPLQLARLRKTVADARHDALSAVEPVCAVEIAEKIEACDRGAIYQSLLELGRSEVTRLLRLVDNQLLPPCRERVHLARLHEAAQALASAAS